MSVSIREIQAGTMGLSVTHAWTELAVHGYKCEVCAQPIDLLRQGPDNPAITDYELYDLLCPDGKVGFAVWRDAKTALMDQLVQVRESAIPIENYVVPPESRPHLTIVNSKPDVCPSCGGVLLRRSGMNGNFIGCSNYPGCKYTARA
jgi:hypothetical protein